MFLSIYFYLNHFNKYTQSFYWMYKCLRSDAFQILRRATRMMNDIVFYIFLTLGNFVVLLYDLKIRTATVIANGLIILSASSDQLLMSA